MEDSRSSDYQSPDDSDQVFEITDFTTATDWERFIADFEEVLRNWDTIQPPDAQDASKPKGVIYGLGPIGDHLYYNETVKLKFAKFVLIVSVYCYQGPDVDNKKERLYTGRDTESDLEDTDENIKVFQDLMDFRYNFPNKAHCIYRWFGVKKFAVISPMEDNLITSEDRAKLLLSSAAIAMRNINVYIPVFVQIHHPQRKFFHGILEGSTSRIMFDMIHFRDIPENYRYLSELTKIFREKIASPLREKVSIELSVRFTHIIREWPQEWLLPEPEATEESTDLEERLYSLDKLPMPLIEYSSPSAPIEELHLSTTWPKLSEEFINDSPNHSNLNSMDAQYWSARVLFRDRFTPNLIHSISSLFILEKSTKYADQPLGKFTGLQEEKEIEAKAALDKLAGVGPPTLTLPQFRNFSTWSLSEHLKCQIVDYIFTEPSQANEPINSLLKDYRGFKSCPYNNLTWRLSIIFHQFKDLNTIAYLWIEIVKKLRDHWESMTDLPSLEPDSPNLGTCLLNQKLQMLNCCIQQKRKREAIKAALDTGKKNIKRTGDDNDGEEKDSEDEFFDAVEDENEFEGKQVTTFEGRSHQLNDLTLVNSDEPLFVPITQDPAPMTEDMMVEQVEILAQLGTSSEGAALRARMQSAQLISDMEAFKAANPGAVLEDFVRWHSPRDFITESDEGGESKGQLSARMQTPGNMWREVWESAKPVAVVRQKLLFDYTKEAEKILHSFESLTLAGLVKYLAPCLIHCATSQLCKRLQTIGYSEATFGFNINDLTGYCSTEDFDKCLNILANLETRIIKAESLKRLFTVAHNFYDASEETPNWNTLNPFILGLIQEKEMEISGGSKGYLGRLMITLFTESSQALYEEKTTVGERYSQAYDKSALPKPIAKEYILRSTCPRPSITSKPLPQRMFALITPNEFRVSGAFSQDTLFR
ncbi:rab3 GTPase-activating protein catalytic subunit [Tetranychus urticae]|nr:rab3 GTPase-activating protein catalytic subunit [Tetranychus urticae]